MTEHQQQEGGEEPTFLRQRAGLLVFTLNQYLETIVKHYPHILDDSVFSSLLGDLKMFHQVVGDLEPMLGHSALLMNIEEMQKLLRKRGEEA